MANVEAKEASIGVLLAATDALGRAACRMAASILPRENASRIVLHGVKTTRPTCVGTAIGIACPNPPPCHPSDPVVRPSFD